MILCVSHTRTSAELLVPGIGHVVASLEDHEIRPVSPASSFRIRTSLHNYSRDVVDLLNEVEFAATILFAQAPGTKWSWEIHGCPDECECYLEVS